MQMLEPFELHEPSFAVHCHLCVRRACRTSPSISTPPNIVFVSTAA